jgi:hypothetical protein
MLIVDASLVTLGALVVQSTRHKRTVSNRRRDPVRLFTAEQKRMIYRACNNQCEYPRLILGRCKRSAQEVDHIYPWSKGGMTIIENASCLCHHHNIHKTNKWPSRRYIRALSRNRIQYFPDSMTIKPSRRPSRNLARQGGAL